MAAIHAPSSTFLLCVREQLCTWQDCADVQPLLSIPWSHMRLMHATHEFLDPRMNPVRLVHNVWATV